MAGFLTNSGADCGNGELALVVHMLEPDAGRQRAGLAGRRRNPVRKRPDKKESR